MKFHGNRLPAAAADKPLSSFFRSLIIFILSLDSPVSYGTSATMLVAQCSDDRAETV